MREARLSLLVLGRQVKCTLSLLPLLNSEVHTARVLLTDRSGQTGAVRYRYIGPVWPETGRYRWNSYLNSNFIVQPVRTGIPAG